MSDSDVQTGKEGVPTVENKGSVRPPKQIPHGDTRRPPEPIRPLPAQRTGVTLLAAQVRRRRYRSGLHFGRP